MLDKKLSFLILGISLLFFIYLLIGELLFVPAIDVPVFVRAPVGDTSDNLYQHGYWDFFVELSATLVLLIVVSFPVFYWFRSVLRSNVDQA